MVIFAAAALPSSDALDKRGDGGSRGSRGSDSRLARLGSKLDPKLEKRRRGKRIWVTGKYRGGGEGGSGVEWDMDMGHGT